LVSDRSYVPPETSERLYEMTALERFEQSIIRMTESGCWLWEKTVDEKGYGRTSLNNVAIKTHRLAWKLFVGEIPEGKHVLHTCDVRSCCNPNHLFLGTHKDNMQDRQNKQRHSHGKTHPRAKLTETEVLYIRKSSERNIDLAVRFDVPDSCICNIKKRKIWRHLP
jgi:hypothetical protein